MQAFDAELGITDDPGLGDDGDVAARLGGEAASRAVRRSGVGQHELNQVHNIGMSEIAERMNVSLATMSQSSPTSKTGASSSARPTPLTGAAHWCPLSPEHRPAIRVLFEQRLRPLDRALRLLEPDERVALIRGLTVLAEELDRTDRPADKAATATKESAR